MRRARPAAAVWWVGLAIAVVLVVEPPGAATAVPADPAAGAPSPSEIRPTPDPSWVMWTPRRELRPDERLDIAYRPSGDATTVERTACVVLERFVDGEWGTLGPLARSAGSGVQDCGDSIVRGLGPDRFELPADLRAGLHRICQVGFETPTVAPATVCLEFEVVAS